MCGWGEKGDFWSSWNWKRLNSIPTFNPLAQKPWPRPPLFPFPTHWSCAAILTPTKNVPLRTQAASPSPNPLSSCREPKEGQQAKACTRLRSCWSPSKIKGLLRDLA